MAVAPIATSALIDVPTQKSELRRSLDGIDQNLIVTALRQDDRLNLLHNVAERSFAQYFARDGAALMMYIHTQVLQDSSPPNLEYYNSWGQEKAWFWESLRLEVGKANIRPAVLAGVVQPLKTDGENSAIGLRTEGLAVHSQPKERQFCYEIRLPVTYATPDGTRHSASLGLFFQWDNAKQDWVQAGASFYGFPVNQPLPLLPG